MPSGTATVSARLKARALELGFSAAGIARVEPLDAIRHYEAWLAAGYHGGMGWLANDKHRARRADIRRVYPAIESVICVALSHEPHADPQRDARLGRIARYARGEDYHRVMRDLLRQLEATLCELLPGARPLWYADTGAILERGWAERAGLGWIGKHSGLLSSTIGSWFVLGEVLVDRPLEADPLLAREHCGTCSRCIEACPTRAIVAPYQVDARLCISYLTIELRGPIPREHRSLMGDWSFGCDICQDVCPWNRFAPPAREARLHARALEGWSLERFLTLDDATFAELFAGSPIRRTGRAGFVRNVCVALGNRGNAEAVMDLATVLAHEPEALVRGHAAWALGEIAHRAPISDARRAAALVALERARADADAFVRDEAMAALRTIEEDL